MGIPCKVEKMKMLTLSQRNLVIGTCLGDGSIERNGKNCRLRIQHSLAQKPLVCWKHGILKGHSLSLKEFSQYDKRTKKTYEKIKFDTKTLTCFNEFYDQFYFEKEKRVPIKIINLLNDPLALAVWYLDDGALRVDSKAFRLHTNSYPMCDVLLLKQVLLENFNILSNLHKQENLKPVITDKSGNNHNPLHFLSKQKILNDLDDPMLKKGYCLHIGARDGQAKKICNLLKPLVAQEVPYMLYKFF